MVDRLTVLTLFKRALLGGARQLGPFEVEWDIAGKCMFPVRRDVTARKTHGVERWVLEVAENWATSDFPPDYLGHQRKKLYGVERIGPHVVHLTVKCRMCDVCLKERRDEWAARAKLEFAKATRVWFGTLTLSPEYQSKFGFLAAELARRKGDVLEALPLDTQLHYRHTCIGVEITKMWKRLRKAGHRFRYFLVLEAHKTFLPHYHALVFEDGKAPLTKRALEGEWPFGFTKWRLAEDDRAVWYAAKYLGKSKAARVRASLGFGSVVTASVHNDASRSNVISGLPKRDGISSPSPLLDHLIISERDDSAPLESLAFAASDRAPT